MKKIILYTKYDLRDFEVIKFNKMYEFENEFIKGSLKTFPTKKDAEKYFKWQGINLEIKDEFWEEMDNIFVLGCSNLTTIYCDMAENCCFNIDYNNARSGK